MFVSSSGKKIPDRSKELNLTTKVVNPEREIIKNNSVSFAKNAKFHPEQVSRDIQFNQLVKEIINIGPQQAITSFQLKLDSPRLTRGEYRQANQKLQIINDFIARLASNPEFNQQARLKEARHRLEFLKGRYQSKAKSAQKLEFKRAPAASEGCYAKLTAQVNRQKTGSTSITQTSFQLKQEAKRKVVNFIFSAQSPENQSLQKWIAMAPEEEQDLRKQLARKILDCKKYKRESLTLDWEDEQQNTQPQSVSLSALPPFHQLGLELTKLYLPRHAISQLDSASFRGLESLKALHMQRGPLDQIATDTFKNFTQLAELRLSLNRLTQIGRETLEPLAKTLQILDLEQNQLASIENEDNFLAPLINLNYLNLNSNKLYEVPPLKSLSNLRELFIGCNQLKTIAANDFSNNKQLETLSLEQNELTYIAKNAFISLITECEIYLSGNQLPKEPLLYELLKLYTGHEKLNQETINSSDDQSSESYDMDSIPTFSNLASPAKDTEIHQENIALVVELFKKANLDYEFSSEAWLKTASANPFIRFVVNFESQIEKARCLGATEEDFLSYTTLVKYIKYIDKEPKDARYSDLWAEKEYEYNCNLIFELLLRQHLEQPKLELTLLEKFLSVGIFNAISRVSRLAQEVKDENINYLDIILYYCHKYQQILDLEFKVKPEFNGRYKLEANKEERKELLNNLKMEINLISLNHDIGKMGDNLAMAKDNITWAEKAEPHNNLFTPKLIQNFQIGEIKAQSTTALNHKSSAKNEIDFVLLYLIEEDIRQLIRDKFYANLAIAQNEEAIEGYLKAAYANSTQLEKAKLAEKIYSEFDNSFSKIISQLKQEYNRHFACQSNLEDYFIDVLDDMQNDFLEKFNLNRISHQLALLK